MERGEICYVGFGMMNMVRLKRRCLIESQCEMWKKEKYLYMCVWVAICVECDGKEGERGRGVYVNEGRNL